MTATTLGWAGDMESLREETGGKEDFFPPKSKPATLSILKVTPLPYRNRSLGVSFAFPLFAALCPSESKEPASTKATRWFAVQASAGVATCVGRYRLPDLAGD